LFAHASKGFGEVATTLSAVEWFVDFYHQLKEQDVPVLECIQRPGDVIFVPHGWFHIVLNLENSVAVTHNYVSESNLFHVMQFLDKTPDHVSGVSEAEKHELGARFRRALRESRPDMLAKLEEAEARARMPSPWDAAKAGEGFSLFKQ
jgi:ribosomal protein L16 Arg81 hydroxylase